MRTYLYLRENLSKLDKLLDQDGAAKVYPTGVCIDEVEPPFAVYNLKSSTAARDLGGTIHHRTEVYWLDILSDSYDEAAELWDNAMDVLEEFEGQEYDGGYIFSVSCDIPKDDGMVLEVDLYRRTMEVTMTYCDCDEE